MLGNSVAGRVASINRLRPDFRVSLLSARETLMLESSFNDLQISKSLRAGTVISPGCFTWSIATLPTNSTSRSVPVSDSSLSFKTKRTLESTGSVCRRSTTPLTICNGFNKLSREMTNCILRIYLIYQHVKF